MMILLGMMIVANAHAITVASDASRKPARSVQKLFQLTATGWLRSIVALLMAGTGTGRLHLQLLAQLRVVV